MPGVVIGRNEHVAWGVTNSMLDGMDLFVMKVGRTLETAVEKPVFCLTTPPAPQIYEEPS